MALVTAKKMIEGEYVEICSFYLIAAYYFMKIKCEHCSNIQEITLDTIIFDDEEEEVFVSYLTAELSKSQSEDEDES